MVQLIFEATQGPQSKCAIVNITRDDGLEDLETHSVFLNSSDTDVQPGPLSATQIIITNFDGERNYCVAF